MTDTHEDTHEEHDPHPACITSEHANWLATGGVIFGAAAAATSIDAGHERQLVMADTVIPLAHAMTHAANADLGIPAMLASWCDQVLAMADASGLRPAGTGRDDIRPRVGWVRAEADAEPVVMDADQVAANAPDHQRAGVLLAGRLLAARQRDDDDAFVELVTGALHDRPCGWVTDTLTAAAFTLGGSFQAALRAQVSHGEHDGSEG